MKIRSNFFSNRFIILVLITFAVANLFGRADGTGGSKIDVKDRNIDRSLSVPIGPGAVYLFPQGNLPISVRWFSFDQEVGNGPMIVKARTITEKAFVFSAVYTLQLLTSSPKLIVNSLLQKVVGNVPQITLLFSINLLSNYSLAIFSHRLTAARLSC